MSPFSPKKNTGKRGISCPYCSAHQLVAAVAESIFCRKCHEYISLKDHVLDKIQVLESIVTRGNILVKRKGEIRGDLTGNTVDVKGSVEGNLSADRRIYLRASARVHGDVSAPRVVMEDGAILVGKCEVQTMSDKPPTITAS